MVTLAVMVIPSQLFFHWQAGRLPSRNAAFQHDDVSKSSPFQYLRGAKGARPFLANNNHSLALGLFQLAHALWQVGRWNMHGIRQAAGGHFLAAAYIDNGGFTPIYQQGRLGRGGFFPALGQGRPQQGATGDKNDADKKDMVENEFHGYPMVELNPRIIK
jgi:hypothetical protein